jgi:hypothetical protein
MNFALVLTPYFDEFPAHGHGIRILRNVNLSDNLGSDEPVR